MEVSVGHGPATAALALFTFAWLRSFGNTRTVRWIGIGALLGLAILMRWQLATFAILPILEAGWLITRASTFSNPMAIAAKLVAAGVASVVVFTPLKLTISSRLR